MREIFLDYAKRGAMTKDDLAKVLKIKPETVRRMAAAGKIPRIPHTRLLRFDPMQMIDIFCASKAEGLSSLTIKRHKTLEKTDGGYLECL